MGLLDQGKTGRFSLRHGDLTVGLRKVCLCLDAARIFFPWWNQRHPNFHLQHSGPSPMRNLSKLTDSRKATIQVVDRRIWSENTRRLVARQYFLTRQPYICM